MPHTDINNWIAASGLWFWGVIGSPFTLPEGVEQPKMNKSRTSEGVIIAVGSSLLSGAILAAFGLLILIPEMQSQQLLTEQAMKSQGERLTQSIAVQTSRLTGHEMRDANRRAEDREEFDRTLGYIRDWMEEAKDELKKHDKDLYVPRNGH